MLQLKMCKMVSSALFFAQLLNRAARYFFPLRIVWFVANQNTLVTISIRNSQGLQTWKHIKEALQEVPWYIFHGLVPFDDCDLPASIFFTVSLFLSRLGCNNHDSRMSGARDCYSFVASPPILSCWPSQFPLRILSNICWSFFLFPAYSKHDAIYSHPYLYIKWYIYEGIKE